MPLLIPEQPFKQSNSTEKLIPVKFVTTVMDGNCMFDAFRQFFALDGVKQKIGKNVTSDQWSHFKRVDTMRDFIVKYVKDHAADFKDFVDESDVRRGMAGSSTRPVSTQKLNKYVQEMMQKPGGKGTSQKYAGNIEMQAICAKCGVQAIVFHHVGNEVQRYQTLPSQGEWDPAKPVVWLYYHERKLHYSLLVPIPPSSG